MYANKKGTVLILYFTTNISSYSILVYPSIHSSGFYKLTIHNNGFIWQICHTHMYIMTKK